MKAKLPNLPTVEELTAELELTKVYPPLAKAQRATEKAERKLADCQAKLTALEKEVIALPARIQRGDAPSKRLMEAMRDRDAVAMMIEPAEREVRERKEQETAAHERALKARDDEIDKRIAVLVKAAETLAPYLARINELELALVQVEDPRNACHRSHAVDWPISNSAELAERHRLEIARRPPPPPVTYKRNGLECDQWGRPLERD